jgi:hypothetical protein
MTFWCENNSDDPLRDSVQDKDSRFQSVQPVAVAREFRNWLRRTAKEYGRATSRTGEATDKRHDSPASGGSQRVHDRLLWLDTLDGYEYRSRDTSGPLRSAIIVTKHNSAVSLTFHGHAR